MNVEVTYEPTESNTWRVYSPGGVVIGEVVGLHEIENEVRMWLYRRGVDDWAICDLTWRQRSRGAQAPATRPRI